MPHRSRTRRRPLPPREIPRAAKVAIGIIGVAVGAFVFLAALWLTQLAMTAGAVAFRERDMAFFGGALLLAALAVIGVSVAGPNLMKGLPFHLAGTVGAYSFGTAFAPFERLRLAGAIIYAASWCWTYLGETAVRYVRARAAARR